MHVIQFVFCFLAVNSFAVGLAWGFTGGYRMALFCAGIFPLSVQYLVMFARIELKEIRTKRDFMISAIPFAPLFYVLHKLPAWIFFGLKQVYLKTKVIDHFYRGLED